MNELNYNIDQNSNVANNFDKNTHYSVALGSGHNINANYAFAGNSYNTIKGNRDSVIRSNAFVVDKDGNANIKRDVIIENNISMKDL